MIHNQQGYQFLDASFAEDAARTNTFFLEMIEELSVIYPVREKKNSGNFIITK